MSQNKSVLRRDANQSNLFAVKDFFVVEIGNVSTYSEKTATRNISALKSCSTVFLEALTDLFVDSHSEKRSYLKVLLLSLSEVMFIMLD